MSVDAAGNQDPAAGSVFSLGWLMAQLYGPLQRPHGPEAPAQLPAVADLGQDDAMNLAFVELERLLAPYPDLPGDSLRTAWAVAGHEGFPVAVKTLHLAILEHFTGDYQQLSAYQLGQALSNTCWLSAENADAELFLGQFGRQRMATLQCGSPGPAGSFRRCRPSL